MYRELEVRPPPVPTSDNELGLTATELKVAIHAAQGLSNKAIAVKLRCATRTVSTHLSNIYTKLGIGGSGARIRLGQIMREAGLVV